MLPLDKERDCNAQAAPGKAPSSAPNALTGRDRSGSGPRTRGADTTLEDEAVPHHKSAFKRLRQTETRRQRNIHYRSRMRSAIKKVRTALEANDVAAAQTALVEATKIIDSTQSKGVIHRRNASRTISRLTRAVSGASQA